MASLERQYFWGCTLSKDKPEMKWLDTDDKNIAGEVDILNQLALSQACLGSKAKDSSHVVQVTTKGVNSNSITQPIIVLGSGVRQVQCRLEFSSPATFKLIEGQGPVHLAGSHIQVIAESYQDSDEEDESMDEGVSSSYKLSPQKEKRQSTPLSGKEKQPPAKKAKREVENGDKESSDDDPDELIPINVVSEKPKEEKDKSEKVKNDKSKKKTAVEEVKLKKTPISAGAKKVMPDEDDDEDDDDEEEDDDGDDDFAVDSDENDDDDDEDDSEDDDDDEDDDDEDDDDESDEDDDEDVDDESDEDLKKKAALNSKKQQQNAKNILVKKDQESKTPTKKPTPNKQTPKKANVDATVNLQKTPDLNTVKAKLLKSPNLPKRIEKFKNFMKTNMKITDEKVVKDMWAYVQANKK